MNLSRFLRFNGGLGLVFIFLSCERQRNNTIVMLVTGRSLSWDLCVSTADPYVEFVISPIFDRFLEGSFMPSLAVSSTNMLPLTWKFQLKINILFHNGSEFTAEDVVFSVQRMKALLGVSFLVSFIRTIKAVSEDTVYIKLSQPHASIVSKKFTVDRDGKIGDPPMATGAYRYARATPGKKINFTAFLQYDGRSASISKNFYRNIPDPVLRTIALEMLEILKKIRHIQLNSFLAPGTEFIGFNFKARSGFSNRHLRKAITIVSDKTGIIRVGVDGTAGRAAFSLSPCISYYTNLHLKPFDLQKAKELIQSAGMWGETFVLSVNEGFRTKIAEVIQVNWKEIGLNIEIQVLQWGKRQDYLAKGPLKSIFSGAWLLPVMRMLCFIFWCIHSMFVPDVMLWVM